MDELVDRLVVILSVEGELHTKRIKKKAAVHGKRVQYTNLFLEVEISMVENFLSFPSTPL